MQIVATKPILRDPAPAATTPPLDLYIARLDIRLRRLVENSDALHKEMHDILTKLDGPDFDYYAQMSRVFLFLKQVRKNDEARWEIEKEREKRWEKVRKRREKEKRADKARGRKMADSAAGLELGRARFSLAPPHPPHYHVTSQAPWTFYSTSLPYQSPQPVGTNPSIENRGETSEDNAEVRKLNEDLAELVRKQEVLQRERDRIYPNLQISADKIVKSAHSSSPNHHRKLVRNMLDVFDKIHEKNRAIIEIIKQKMVIEQELGKREQEKREKARKKARKKEERELCWAKLLLDDQKRADAKAAAKQRWDWYKAWVFRLCVMCVVVFFTIPYLWIKAQHGSAAECWRTAGCMI